MGGHYTTEMIEMLLFGAFLGFVLSCGVFELVKRRRESQFHRLANIPFDDTTNNVEEGVYQATLVGELLRANKALVRMYGFESEMDLRTHAYHTCCEWFLEGSRRADFKATLEATDRVTNSVYQIENRQDGRMLWVSETAWLVRDPLNGSPLYYEGFVRDVTEARIRAELEQRLEKLAAFVPGALFQFIRDPSGIFHGAYVSERLGDLTGLDVDRISQKPGAFWKFVHEDYKDVYLAELDRSAKELCLFEVEFEFDRPDGRTVWLMMTAKPERAEDGSIIWHGYLSDISDRKRSELEIRHLAYFDALTGLPNRRLLRERLDQSLEACHRSSTFGAVLFIDMDNFKGLNDTQGHEVGDMLLRLVGERIAETVRPADTVSRFGGDEFVVVLHDLGPDRDQALSAARTIAGRVLASFDTAFDLNGVRHKATPSIGVIVFDGMESGSQELLRCADIAMYEAKRNGRNNFVLHNPESVQRVSELFGLQAELRSGLERGEFVFAFQPIVRSNGEVASVEALIRWNHPTRGLIMPSEFIPVAEQTGLIIDINQWVLEQGCHLLGRWRNDPVLCSVGLSVNVSVQQFHADDFASSMAVLMADARVEPFKLTVEITEHVMARDQDHVSARMHDLRELGVRFALDDFGTGYSSLSQLKRFPFDSVKIDGSFISDLERVESNRALVGGILAMARTLQLDTVAEHVETKTQMDFLKENRCDFFQGYYVSAAVTESELADLITASTAQPRQADSQAACSTR